MRILVHDANLLIDLFHGGLLEIWFAQGYEIHTTSLVLTELTDANQKAAADGLVSRGALIISDTAASEWSAAEKLAQTWGVSIPDASVALLARKMDAVLMTGDGTLRKKALAKKMEVKGTLWVMDELVARDALSYSEALEALRKILESGSFLPQVDCRMRIEKWSGG
jgi:predicted nucleic acid-binding protein